MSTVEIFNTILITGVIYGFTFNAIIFLNKKRKGRPILFLNLLVLFISLNNLQAWLIDQEYIFLKYLRIPWYFLCAPLFLVFLVHYLKIHKKVQSFLYTSVFIFIGLILLRLSLILYTQVNNFSEFDTGTYIDNYSNNEEIGGFIYALFILFYAVVMFTKKKKALEFVLKYDDLRWIKHFLNLFGIILIIWVIAMIQDFQDGAFSTPRIYFPLRLITSVMIYWVGIKGLFRYRTMEDRIVLRENIHREIPSQNIGERESNIISNAIDEHVQEKSEKQLNNFTKINSYVINQKKFLDPYLSLESLAKELKISGGYLSLLINTYSVKNFSDYINGFRIDQVTKLIIDSEYVNYTIESIGLESGFNSKSTFYSAFKKFTGQSPRQFRRQSVKQN
jgi:AraC-like DNA-binding protein